MMKKVFLFSMMFLLISGTIFAQLKSNSVINNSKKITGFKQTKNTKSAVTSNWYNFMNSVYQEGKSQYIAEVLFPDTLPIIRYGVDTENQPVVGRPFIHSIATIIDPFSNYFSYFGKDQVVLSPYTVDSIGFLFYYTRELADENIVDTLIFEYWKIEESEIPYYAISEFDNMESIYVEWDETNYQTSPNLPGIKGFNKYVKKVPLDASNVGVEADNFMSYISFKAGLSIGRWGIAGCAVSFKPGYTYVADDTLNNLNYVEFVSLEESYGEYNNFTGDYNCSYVLPSGSIYYPKDTIYYYNNDAYFNNTYKSSYFIDFPAEYPYEHHAFDFLISTIIPEINLVTPNTSADYLVGSTVDIKWTSNGLTNVKIEYMGGNATTWQTMSASVASYSDSVNVYKWTIPTNFKEDNNYKIKISHLEFPNNVYDESESTFTIGAPSLDFVYPAINSVLYSGTSQNIEWTSKYVDAVKIEIITVSYTNIWETIISSTDATTGTYAWTVPALSSKDCKIRISDVNNPNLKAESGKFTIKNPIIQVNYPNGGEKILKGTPVKLEWMSEDVEYVKIQYKSQSNGNWFTLVGKTLSSDAYYIWVNPSTLSNEYLIKISDESYPSAFDISDTTFSVVPTLVGIENDNNEILAFAVYPNPSDAYLNINFVSNKAEINMQITDYAGRVIKTERLINYENKIDVSSLSSGIYFVKIIDSKQNIQTIKFVKN